MNVKNSQVAVICAVILAAALIVAASNIYLVQIAPPGAFRPAAPPRPRSARRPRPRHAVPRQGQLTVAMMPKSKGNAYFIACRKGAEEAARELGVKLIWDGPTDPDPAKQNEVIDTWITRGVDVIAVAVENRQGISSVLRKARERGIKVVTWDADAEPDARDFFVNQATPEGIGQTLMDNAARVLGGKGKFAIITASLTAANMIEWQKTHRGPPRREVPRDQDGRPAALRRPSEKGVRRDDHDPERRPRREADHGHLLARRPGRRRGRQAGGPDRRQGDRPGPSQRQQTLYPRRHHRLRRPLEHHGPGLPDGLRRRRPRPKEPSSPATHAIKAGRLGQIEIAGRQHPARQAVHLHARTTSTSSISDLKTEFLVITKKSA